MKQITISTKKAKKELAKKRRPTQISEVLPKLQESTRSHYKKRAEKLGKENEALPLFPMIESTPTNRIGLTESEKNGIRKNIEMLIPGKNSFIVPKGYALAVSALRKEYPEWRIVLSHNKEKKQTICWRKS